MRAALLLVVLAACGDNQRCDPSRGLCHELSEYGFFTGERPVIPYDVNTPLFSDYTTKQRYLYLPPGTTATWQDPDAFELPVGAALIKTFSYDVDRRDPGLGANKLETRVLFHFAEGWRGGAYVYDGPDAYLSEAGTILDTAWIHDDGTARTNAYVVPNENQCKTCHGEHDEMTSPLGMKARHINREGQLEQLVASGALAGAPDASAWPRAPNAFDASTGTLDQRARAWLDINCAHCHNPAGKARTS